jgi:D-sedoheptulose 7-phosphate isomerase
MIKYYLNNIDSIINNLQDIKSNKELLTQFSKIVDISTNTISHGGKLIFIGNGGSAADSQHIAAEFISKLKNDRQPLPALALTTDTSAITAIGNDYGFDHIFSRQLEAVGKKGDTLFAISTSGRSPNIHKAIDVARDIGISVIGITGGNGIDLINKSDAYFYPETIDTARIQEMHIIFWHSLCEAVEIGWL